MSQTDPGEGFPTPQDMGGDRIDSSYDKDTGRYHYTISDSENNIRISWDTDREGNYAGGLHMVDQDTGETWDG